MVVIYLPGSAKAQEVGALLRFADAPSANPQLLSNFCSNVTLVEGVLVEAVCFIAQHRVIYDCAD